MLKLSRPAAFGVVARNDIKLDKPFEQMIERAAVSAFTMLGIDRRQVTYPN